jgi:hypothetical protein
MRFQMMLLVTSLDLCRPMLLQSFCEKRSHHSYSWPQYWVAGMNREIPRQGQSLIRPVYMWRNFHCLHQSPPAHLVLQLH